MNNNILKKNQEYFLFLLPVYFVFHGFVENYASVAFSEVFYLLIEYLLATAILFLIFYFIFRSLRKTALFVFALMSFHFFFGAMHDTAKKLIPHTFFVKYVFILPLTFICFIILIALIYRSSRRLDKLVKFLNLVLVVLILLDIPFLIKKVTENSKKINFSGTFIKTNRNRPDIYLIVSDGYAGHEELSQIFHYDNSPFEQFLTSKGFHIVKNSRSNYNYTPFSTSSMLSMNFLKSIEGSNSSIRDMNVCYGLINKNSLWDFFITNGYEIKNYSIFNVNNIPTKAPQNLITLGNKLITSQTFLSRLDRDIRFNLVTRLKLKTEIYRVDNYVNKCNHQLYDRLLKESQQSSEKPKFVYTHLLMPHYPYYYDSTGKENPLELVNEADNPKQKDQYLSYLKYCNKQYTKLINTIFSNTKNASIIIFMSDHGFRQFTDNTDQRFYFMNFNAVYFPDGNYSQFYDGMSNVNQFRVILNSEFGQRLPLLKDSSSFLKE